MTTSFETTRLRVLPGAKILGTALSLFLLQGCVSEVADQEILFDEGLPYENSEDFEPLLPDDFDDGADEGEPVVWSPIAQEYTGLTYPVRSLYGSIERPVEIQGENLVHGDMIVGTVEGLHQRQAELARGSSDELVALSNPATDSLQPWPSHEIPYEYASDIPASDPRRVTIAEAIRRWNSQTQILLRPRNNHEQMFNKSFLEFTGNNYGACQADTGYAGPHSVTRVMISPNCDAGAIIHEVGHAVGLDHEQGRPDRDDNVSINWSAVPYGTANWNFWIGGVGFGPYDFQSRMHYDNFAFSTDGSMTIVRNGCSSSDTSGPCRLGGNSFSPGDTAGIRRIQDGDSPTYRTRYRNLETAQCLRSTGDHMTPGDRLRQSSCSNTVSRKWYTVPVTTTGEQALVHHYSRLCVNRNGTAETLGACSSGTSTNFTRRTVSSNRYRLEVNGRCLQASSGYNTRFEPCDGADDQLWERLD